MDKNINDNSENRTDNFYSRRGVGLTSRAAKAGLRVAFSVVRIVTPLVGPAPVGWIAAGLGIILLIIIILIFFFGGGSPLSSLGGGGSLPTPGGKPGGPGGKKSPKLT